MYLWFKSSTWMNIALVGLGFVSLSQEDTIRQLKGKVVKLRMIWIDSKSLLLYFFFTRQQGSQ
jgi:hypothetical protein